MNDAVKSSTDSESTSPQLLSEARAWNDDAWRQIVYRYGPNRRGRRPKWITPGAIVATLLWMVVSVAFGACLPSLWPYLCRWAQPKPARVQGARPWAKGISKRAPVKLSAHLKPPPTPQEQIKKLRWDIEYRDRKLRGFEEFLAMEEVRRESEHAGVLETMHDRIKQAKQAEEKSRKIEKAYGTMKCKYDTMGYELHTVQCREQRCQKKNVRLEKEVNDLKIIKWTLQKEARSLQREKSNLEAENEGLKAGKTTKEN